MSPRRPCRAVALIFGAFASTSIASAQVATGNFGVVISEIAHGLSLPFVNGQPMPSFIEIVNRQIANPVVPPPIPLGGSMVTVTVNGATASHTIPSTILGVPTLLGGNVQPPPAVQPAVPPAHAAVFLIAQFQFPSGVLPPGVMVSVAPGLFTGPLAPFAGAGAATNVRIQFQSLNTCDQLVVPPAVSGPPCSPSSPPFIQTGALTNPNGRVVRWVYMDSNTDIDFDGDFAATPGFVNPAMSHVDGFLFGATSTPGFPHPEPALGAPLNFQLNTGSTTAGTVFSSTAATVSAIKFENANPPYSRVITDPVFDRVLGQVAVVLGTYLVAGPSTFPSLPDYQSQLMPSITTTLIVPSTAIGFPPGVLTMPMTNSMLVSAAAEPKPGVPGQFRIRRTYTDSVADSGSSGTGDLSDGQLDTIPGSTGGGNTWCEVIVYDAAGNRYMGKAKNWPPGGGCGGGPKLALGTTGGGVGDAMMIDYCFGANAMVFNLFSATLAGACTGPLLFGICPDALTLSMISPPYPLGTEPFHIATDSEGVYGWSAPAGALLFLAGLTFEGVGIEYDGFGVVQVSSTSTVTF